MIITYNWDWQKRVSTVTETSAKPQKSWMFFNHDLNDLCQNSLEKALNLTNYKTFIEEFLSWSLFRDFLGSLRRKNKEEQLLVPDLYQDYKVIS